MPFITVPIDTDPQSILDDVYTFIQSVIPGWTPQLGNLDVWLAMSFSIAAAENRDVASDVPPAIFRYFGNSVLKLPPIDATPAHTTTTWTVVNNDGYTIPIGTQVGIPGADGLDVVFLTQADVVIPPGSTVATLVSVAALIDGEDGSGLGSIGGAMVLEDSLSFVVSVTQDTITTGGQDAESDDLYLDRLAGDLQLLTPAPILPHDFAVLLRNIPGVYRATAIDGYNPFHNLLSLNDASVETSIAGWVALLNCSIVQTVAQAADGSHSLSMTATALGDMAIQLLGADGPAVTPGDVITGVAFLRAATTSRSIKVGLSWFDNTNTQIGAIVYGTIGTDVTTGFTEATVTATAPAAAATVRLVAYFISAAAGGVHYVDKMSLRRGTGVDWVPGGTAETGNPRTISVAGQDSSGAALDSATKIAGQAYLASLREATFLAYVIDPLLTLIDVTYQIHLMPGFDSATVLANVNAAINAFLNPATWGSSGTDALSWTNNTTLRLNKMIQVIEDVQGVDYAPTGQVKMALHGGTVTAADITLPGPFALPDASTLVGSVV